MGEFALKNRLRGVPRQTGTLQAWSRVGGVRGERCIIYTYICICICICISPFIYIYIYLFKCQYICIYTYILVYVICIYIYMYIYIYIYFSRSLYLYVHVIYTLISRFTCSFIYFPVSNVIEPIMIIRF